MSGGGDFGGSIASIKAESRGVCGRSESFSEGERTGPAERLLTARLPLSRRGRFRVTDRSKSSPESSWTAGEGAELGDWGSREVDGSETVVEDCSDLSMESMVSGVGAGCKQLSMGVCKRERELGRN